VSIMLNNKILNKRRATILFSKPTERCNSIWWNLTLQTNTTFINAFIQQIPWMSRRAGSSRKTCDVNALQHYMKRQCFETFRVTIHLIQMSKALGSYC
jgi:hypothetical protein